VWRKPIQANSHAGVIWLRAICHNFRLERCGHGPCNILSGAQRILDLIAEYERAPGDSPLSATLLDQIGEADGWNLEHRIKSLITNLHAPESDRVVGTLSGGEKRRVALCRALLARPDFLILDEPTNHLDTGSIEWLEDFLARYAGNCLFVTHDRYFLDRVATRIVELSRGEFTATTATTRITCSRARNGKRSRRRRNINARSF